MKWIWTKRNEPYVTVSEQFNASTSKGKLYISAPTGYFVYLNGEMVANSQYADYPFAKTVEEIEVSLTKSNCITITAYNMQTHTSTNYDKVSALCFKVVDEKGEVLAQSSENTLIKKADGYIKQDYCVTSQLGPAWKYDFTARPRAYEKAKVIDTGFTTVPRTTPKCKLTEVLPAKLVETGSYGKFNSKNIAEIMQKAPLKAAGEPSRTVLNMAFGQGCYAVVDLGAESAGYLSLNIEVKKKCTAYIGWGEHLTDGRVRTKIGPRNFAIELKLKKGVNELNDYIHRLGGRYLCIFVKANEFTLNCLSTREQYYPFNILDKDFGDERLNAIYALGARTLTLCAHEHYEDCPWREQALYGMDSRNQMLFGYGAFGETALPKANLKTIALGMREDGLIDLTAPAKCDIKIPVFSLYFVLAICENAEFSFDKPFVEDMLPAIESVMKNYEDRLLDGSCTCYTDYPFWNFYEWVDGLDGGKIFRDKSEILAPCREAIATALFAIVADKLAKLYLSLGNSERAEHYKNLCETAKNSLENFYDETENIYYSFIDETGKKYGKHAYTQTIVACAVDRENALRILDKIKNPDESIVKQTLSALPWKYDAIMALDGDIDYCVNEIKTIFGGFIDKGLTSYPETEKLEADFGDAGSLCHAWSSIPCYFLDRYYKK